MFFAQIRIHGSIKRTIICIKGRRVAEQKALSVGRFQYAIFAARRKFHSSKPGIKLTMTFYSGSRAVCNKPYLTSTLPVARRGSFSAFNSPQRNSYRNRDTFALTRITLPVVNGRSEGNTFLIPISLSFTHLFRSRDKSSFPFSNKP